MSGQIVVIGVGDPQQHDGGIGPSVVDQLRHMGLGGVRLVDSEGDASTLIDLWENTDLAIVVNAVRAEPSHPGRVHRLTVSRQAGERARAATAHGMEIGTAVELAREAGRLPRRLVLFAVETGEPTPGGGRTPAVTAAAGKVAAEIAAEIHAVRTA